jgi:hypothetical protein
MSQIKDQEARTEESARNYVSNEESTGLHQVFSNDLLNFH